MVKRLNKQLNKGKSLLLLMYVTLANKMYAQSSSDPASAAKSIITNLVGLVNGGVVNAIIVGLVVVLGLVLLVNKDNETVKKRAIQAIIAVAILKAASTIAGALFGESDTIGIGK